MSRLKSLFYSIFTARRRRYDLGVFGEEYFSPGRPDTERARRYIDIFRPESVLDVGCGTGRLVHGFRLAGADARGTEAAVAAIGCADPEVRPYLEVG
ncbi:MAG TPA: hypothetical protein VLA34_14655, partial [Candidatus Krumholzibacterium sp.]|nr:hypothetical protein [Candidatus Krumholzibacterium sp.]